MKIKVTQEHINLANETRKRLKGLQYDESCYCPVAIAAKEHFGLPDNASPAGYETLRYCSINAGIFVDYNISEEGRRFISAYDEGHHVEPFELELISPEED